MRNSPGKILAALCLLGSIHTPATMAGMYKWVDENGEVHYSDRVPPAEIKQERKLLNEQGRTVKVYERAKTEEEIAEAKRQRAIQREAEKKAAEQAKKDKVLLATYTSTSDMINARDGKLASIEGLIELTEHRIESMQSRLAELTEDAASYERSGKKVPDVITRQIENIRKQTSENEAFIATKREEQQAIRAKFDRDIMRFNELKSHRKK
ncbi:MAG: DUF4124 domain-containing protein [Gammaproteobacteria bacterium]|jgi:hypothetical protein